MKKSRIIFLAVLAVVLVVTVSIIGYSNNVISKAKTGYLVYANESINVIDLETTTKTEYNVDGYSKLRCIGKYYGGDFCCLAFNNETKEQEILLFKNGAVEKSYHILYIHVSITAYNDKVYYLTYDSSNKGDLVCINGDETKIIESDIEDFALNSLGELVYIKEITDDNYSAESNSNGELYYYTSEKAIKLGEAYRVQWLSDKELLVGAEKVDIKRNVGGDLISASHTYEDYLVTVENNEWIYSKEFNKIPHIVSVSPDNNKAITFITDEYFTTPYFGIYHIEKDVFSKKAIYDGVNNEDVFDGTSSNMLWLNKNPME